VANSICPSCLTKYEGDTATCAKDGTALVPETTFAAVDKDLVPGDAVGEYQIERKIGEGGFGAVYRAVHPVIGKQAAVKVLGRQFSANATMVSRFIAEARAVNQIRHRNIVDIFSFGALPDGRQYYIMELLEGTPFDKYLDQQKRLSLAQAMPILRGIARALDAAARASSTAISSRRTSSSSSTKTDAWSRSSSTSVS
jgi:eukaryotic-like serine/threonine-protein kinase